MINAIANNGARAILCAMAFCAYLSLEPHLWATDLSRVEEMQGAWDLISRDDVKNADPRNKCFVPFKFGDPTVDRFLLDKLTAQAKSRLAPTFNREKLSAIVKANRERGCVWLICQKRPLSAVKHARVILAGFHLDYREWYQYLADFLMSQDITRGVSPLAPDPRGLYAWRLCDTAYGSLCRRLESIEVLQAAGKKANWKKPFEALSPQMTFLERDKQIKCLWNLLKTPEAVNFVSSCPSALEALKKSKEMISETKVAERILGRCRPKLIKLAIAKEEATLSALLDNEQPPLTAKEKKARERLLKKEYSAKDVVSRLRQSRLRDRGHIEWVILHRKDRTDIATSLIAMYEGDKYPSMRLPLIELMAELLRTWKSVDKPAADKITEFLKKVSADETTHWTVKEVASEILLADGQVRGKK